MDEHRQVYKGRNIVVRQAATEVSGARVAAEGAIEGPKPELYIDNQPIVTVRDSAGMYLASGFAYAPQTSLTDLAKRIIDYRDATGQGEEHGHPEEPGEPDDG